MTSGTKLEGRIALVTGASQGIGLAIATAFHHEGAQVILHYRGEDNEGDARRAAANLSESGGREPFIVMGDVTVDREVEALFGKVNDEFGGVDVLVNNAGVLSQHTIQDMPVSEWDRIISTNLRGVFMFTRLAVPHMIRKRWGRIISIASQLGQIGGAEMSHYSASKAGIIGFTKSIARELGQYNVTANCIAPGPIETDMLKDETEDWRKTKLSELPLRRFGQVWEVAPTAVLLASDPDGNLYTGQTLGPNSGDVML